MANGSNVLEEKDLFDVEHVCFNVADWTINPFVFCFCPVGGVSFMGICLLHHGRGRTLLGRWYGMEVSIFHLFNSVSVGVTVPFSSSRPPFSGLVEFFS